jgi:hypothetical protein
MHARLSCDFFTRPWAMMLLGLLAVCLEYVRRIVGIFHVLFCKLATYISEATGYPVPNSSPLSWLKPQRGADCRA